MSSARRGQAHHPSCHGAGDLEKVSRARPKWSTSNPQPRSSGSQKLIRKVLSGTLPTLVAIRRLVWSQPDRRAIVAKSSAALGALIRAAYQGHSTGARASGDDMVMTSQRNEFNKDLEDARFHILVV